VEEEGRISRKKVGREGFDRRSALRKKRRIQNFEKGGEQSEKKKKGTEERKNYTQKRGGTKGPVDEEKNIVDR